MKSLKAARSFLHRRARPGEPITERQNGLVPVAQLWGLAAGLAVRSARSRPAAAWDLLIHPIDFIRCPEYQTVFTQLAIAPGSRICDVSSPKLPAVHLARSFQVVAGDVLLDEVLLWQRRVRQVDRRPALLTFDGTRLPFPDRTFDLTYSISVLEHIYGEGDTETVNEIVRVTKDGGYVAINVPYDVKRRETYVHHDVYGKHYEGRPIFLGRTYDAQTLHDRLLHPGVDWSEPVYIYERRRIARVLFAIPRPLRWGLTAAAPLWAALIYGNTKNLAATQRPGLRLMEITMVGRKGRAACGARRVYAPSLSHPRSPRNPPAPTALGSPDPLLLT